MQFSPSKSARFSGHHYSEVQGFYISSIQPIKITQRESGKIYNILPISRCVIPEELKGISSVGRFSKIKSICTINHPKDKSVQDLRIYVGAILIMNTLFTDEAIDTGLQKCYC